MIYLGVEVIVNHFSPPYLLPFLASLLVEKDDWVALGEHVHVLEIGAGDGELHLRHSVQGRNTAAKLIRLSSHGIKIG